MTRIRFCALAAAVVLAGAATNSAFAVGEASIGIAIDNFTFAPTEVTVKAGTKVLFTNHDDIPHTVVLDEGKVRSRPMDTDDSFAFIFDTPGEFIYFCGLHPQMKGKIIVTR